MPAEIFAGVPADVRPSEAETPPWRRRPINVPLYHSLGPRMDAINGVAKAMTGDRRHLHVRPHTAS